MADLVKHTDLSVEQIAEIQKSLLVSLRSKEAFWDKFCSHSKIGDGYSSYKWRKLNIPQLKQSDMVNLTEGVTPAGLSMEYVAFSVAPVNFGDWIGYTDESKKYNFDDVTADAKEILAQRAFESVEGRKAKQFIQGTCTLDLNANNVTDGFMKDLLKARTILRKNKVQPLRNGKYGCIIAPEHAAEVLLAYKDKITHTSEKEAIINGYIGELAGFILFENADDVMYKQIEAANAVAAVAGSPLAANAAGTEGVTYYTRASSAAGAGYLNDGTYKYTKADSVPAEHEANVYYPLTTVGSDAVEAAVHSYVLFLGKTEKGLPVETVAFGDDSVKVINKPLGSLPQAVVESSTVVGVRGDTLDQRGSVGFKVMGFATRILHDEAIIRGEHVLADGIVELNVTDSARTGYTGKSTSPSVE